MRFGFSPYSISSGWRLKRNQGGLYFEPRRGCIEPPLVTEDVIIEYIQSARNVEDFEALQVLVTEDLEWNKPLTEEEIQRLPTVDERNSQRVLAHAHYVIQVNSKRNNSVSRSIHMDPWLSVFLFDMPEDVIRHIMEKRHGTVI
jgi:hypothetical protein